MRRPGAAIGRYANEYNTPGLPSILCVSGRGRHGAAGNRPDRARARGHLPARVPSNVREPLALGWWGCPARARRAYYRVDMTNRTSRWPTPSEDPLTYPTPATELPRVMCVCVYALGQSCPGCDPEGRAFAVVRPELGARIIG